MNRGSGIPSLTTQIVLLAVGLWSFPAYGATCISPTVSSSSFTSYIETPASYESGTYPGSCSSCDSVLSGARNAWNTTCSAAGIPQAVEAAPDGAISVRVDIFFQGANTGEFSIDGCGGNRCGCAFIQHRDGQVVGGLIRMFQRTSTGTDCTSSWTGVLTHELGHAFGLGDVSAGCENFIMGNINGGVGINGAECAEIDSSYDTAFDDDHTISGDGDHPCTPVK